MMKDYYKDLPNFLRKYLVDSFVQIANSIFWQVGDMFYDVPCAFCFSWTWFTADKNHLGFSTGKQQLVGFVCYLEDMWLSIVTIPNTDIVSMPLSRFQKQTEQFSYYNHL